MELAAFGVVVVDGYCHALHGPAGIIGCEEGLAAAAQRLVVAVDVDGVWRRGHEGVGCRQGGGVGSGLRLLDGGFEAAAACALSRHGNQGHGEEGEDEDSFHSCVIKVAGTASMRTAPSMSSGRVSVLVTEERKR